MIKFYNVKDLVKDDNKLQESQIKEIEVNDEEDLKPLTAVEINNTQIYGKIEKDDKQSFEDFKNMYKGVIDLKCNQEYGSNEDKDLWEDMAKQLYLNSKEYILQGDEHKPQQLEKKEESNKLQEEEITPANIKEKALEILPKEDVDVKDSDLYIKVSDKSKELINKLQFKNSGLLTTFRSPIDNEMWYDIPFANLEDYITSKTESNNNTYDYKSGDVVDILDSYGKWLNSSDRIKYVIDRPATKEEIEGIWDIDTPCYIVKTLGMTDDTKFLNGTSKEPITRLRHTIYKSKEHKINESFDLDLIEKNIKGKRLSDAARYLGALVNGDRNSFEIQGSELVSKLDSKDKVMCAVEGNDIIKSIVKDFTHLTDKTESKQLESRDRVAENLSKFIYDLTTEQDTEAYGETAWSGNQPTKMGNGVTVYEVYKNGKSNYTMDDIKKAVIERFPELDVYATAYNSILFYKPQKTENKLQENNTDLEYRYMLLDRLKQDCEYFLGNGNGNAEHSLWAKDIDEQIAKMKELYNSFTDDQKPEWITMEDIDNYEKKMKELNDSKEKKTEGVPDLQTIQHIEEYINNIKDEHTKSILHHILEDEKSKENPSIGYLTMAIRKVLDIEQERNKEKKTESMPDDWYKEMFSKYVPNTGEANTIGGEILRTFSGISRMFYQNGDKIWRGNMKNNSYVLDPLADKLDDLLPQEGKDLMSIMANSTTYNAYEKRLNVLEDYVYNYLKNNEDLFGDDKIQESHTNNQIRDKEALDEVIDLAIERIENDKSLIDDFWGSDAENNTHYNDFIIDVCNNLNIDWNTFNVFEDAYVEDKIQSHFQKDIDAKGKKEESAISDYTLSEINKVLNSNGNDFTIKIVNSNEDAQTKTLNIDREDLISIYNVLGGNKDSLQEDQYENERRKGKPSIKKIAEDEYYDNQDWYIQHIKDYDNEDDFIKKEIAEIAEEYNLKENTARSVCKEIYKLAKDVLTESRPDKQAARDKMFRDSKMKLKLPNKFKDINEIVSYLEKCDNKTDVMNVNVAVGGFNRQLHNDMLDFADKFIKENGYLDTYIDKDGNEQEGKFEQFKQAMIDFVKNYKLKEESIIEEAVTDPENPDNKDTIGITVVYEKAVTFYYVRNPKKVKGDKVFKVTDTVYVPRDKARDYLDGKISYKEMESIIYNIIDRSCRKWNKEHKDYLHKDYEPFRIITFDVFEWDFE